MTAIRHRFVRLLWIGLLALGLAAPWIANDVPLVVWTGGSWRAPAITGDTTPPDGHLDWTAWLASLPRDSADGALLAPWPRGPRQVFATAVLAPPSLAHPLGTDDAGHDQLARLIHALRTALWVGLGATALAALLGIPLGLAAGLRGGLVDGLVLRALAFCTAIPLLLALIAVTAFLGGSLWLVILVLAFAQWPVFARMVRGELLGLRERGWVETAQALGIHGPRLWFGHLAPSLQGPIGVCAALLAVEAILAESALTFLGLGAGLDTVSLGAMLDQGRNLAHLDGTWHLWVVPAGVLAVLAVSIHGAVDRRSPALVASPTSPAVDSDG